MKFTTGYSTLVRIALGLGTLSFLPSVEALIAQCVAGWEWSYNSMGQNPCAVAGLLQAPCLGYSTYDFGPLGEGIHYFAPRSDQPQEKKCGCNTVIYSLYISCAICQWNMTNPPITNWMSWSQFCDNVTVSQYPFEVPYNVTVPHWTFLNYTSTFDPTLAKAAGRDPEATHRVPATVPAPSSTSDSPPNTSSLTGITSAPTPGTGTSSTPSSTSSGGSDGGGNSGGTKTNIAAIAGGVVGGVVGLAGFAGLAFFFLKRRGESGDAVNILGPDQAGYNLAMAQPTHDQLKFYNPADPSTFPSPESGSSHSGGFTSNSHRPGRYNGAAEL